MTNEPGLRERKKRETRQLISDIATGLFLERGFDEVTVVEVAAAADVSAKTVFNYFPRKEDLFLDRFPEVLELMTSAVRDRPEGVNPIRALRDAYLRLVAERSPLGGYGRPEDVGFWDVVVRSPALQSRLREFVQEMEDLLADLFAEATGAPADDPDIRMAALGTVGVIRTAQGAARRWVAAGRTGDDLVEALDELIERLFDRLEAALAQEWGSSPPG